MDKVTKNFILQIGVVFILNIFICFQFNTIPALLWIVIATGVVAFNHIFFMQKNFKKLNIINWIIYILFMALIFYVGLKYGGGFDVFPYPAFILSTIALVKNSISKSNSN